jgi:PKD domain
MLRRRSWIALAVALFALSAAAPAQAAPTWLAPTDLAPASPDPAAASGVQDIAMAPDGTVVALYGSNEACCAITVQARVRPPGGTFGPPQQLSASLAGHVAFSPALAVDQSGNFAAVWVEVNGPNTIVRGAIKPAAGSGFGSSMDLSGIGQNASSPDIAIAGDTAIAVWTRSNGTHTIVQEAIKPAGSAFFGSAGDLSAAGASANNPRIEMSAAGGAIVGWQRPNGSGQAVIQAAFRPPGGSFAALADVYTNTTTNGHIDGPQVAIAPDNRATIAWASFDGTFNRHIIYAAARGPSGNFAGLDTVSDPAIDSGSSGYFDLDVSQSNTALMTWNAGTVEASTRPSGGAFSDSLQTLSQPGIAVGNPSVEFAPDGGAVAVWQNFASPISAVQAAEMVAGGQFGAVTDLAAGSSATGPFYVGPMPVTVDGQGNAATIFGKFFDTDPGPGTLYHYLPQAVGYDAAAPSLGAISVPAAGIAGSGVPMSATARDVWSSVTPSWGFGDGSGGSGDSVGHVYATPGPKTVTITATDAVGNITSQTREIAIAPAPTKSLPLKLGVKVPKQSWKAIRKAKGITLSCTLDAVGICSATASVSRGVATRLGLKVGKRAKTLTVGSGSVKVNRINRSTTFRIVLTSAARAAIAQAARAVPIAITVKGSAADRTSAVVKRTLTVTPPVKKRR